MRAYFDYLIATFVHSFNSFFNTFCRESENPIIIFIWKTSILLGWIKLFIECKGIFEFILRHFMWSWWWKSGFRGYHLQKKMKYVNEIG